jgi:nicotinamide riboside transporter PnuC
MTAEFLNSISWLFSIINLVGYVFVIKKKPTGFVLIIIANIFWILLNNAYELYSQAITLVLFTGITAYGWWDWKFPKKSD